MTLRCVSYALRVAAVVCVACLPAVPLWAQDENETVGFQTNHAFESGQFGENIDVLNGGLHLTIPIGPSYKVSQNLGYQLQLVHNSKVWSTDRWGDPADFGSYLSRRSGVGIGFSLHLGRIYRDIDRRAVTVVINNIPQQVYRDIYTWTYVSPDGNEHELPGLNPEHGSADVDDAPSGTTLDNTFYNVYFTDMLSDWNGVTTPIPTFYLETPEKIRYIFGHFIQIKDHVGNPFNSRVFASGEKACNRDENRAFGGWYVTRIEDMRSNYDTIAQQHDVRVDIEYDTRPGYEHLISQITDTSNPSSTTEDRKIVFTNSNPDSGNPGRCLETVNRHTARTTEIQVPAFGTSMDAAPGTYAAYNFTYDVRITGNQPIKNVDSGDDEPGPDLLLTRIDYPQFSKRSGPDERYSMSFTYNEWGELDSRTLPTGATINYTWGSYTYTGAGNFAQGIVGFTRQVIEKWHSLAPGRKWRYVRGTSQFSNPHTVTVTDSLDNDTVYYYQASPKHPLGLGDDPDDGFSPEWDDGVNYLVEYYQGTGSARKVLRSERREYESDPDPYGTYPGPRAKNNVRVYRTVTTYHDDGAKQSTAASNYWDDLGHYRETVESGDDIEGVRKTWTDYFSTDSRLFHFREVSDGTKVLRRTDNVHSGSFLMLSIDRATLPAAISTEWSSTPAIGDIVTAYRYDASTGNVTRKEIGDEGATQSATPGEWDVTAPEYGMTYGWQPAGYLASKVFTDVTAGVDYEWNAIDRTRDGNTGAIYQSRDTAGVQTDYEYDQLGRLIAIRPAGPEHPTEIEYVNNKETVLRQGDPLVMGTDFYCNEVGGDYIMSCYTYDDLGRLILTEKRSYDAADTVNAGIAHQETSYQVTVGATVYDLDQPTYKSQWLWSGEASIGTAFDFIDPATSSPAEFDPFGRVRRVIPADGTASPEFKVTKTDYFGLSSIVTLTDIQGADATGAACTFSTATTYRHDVWDRLVRVESPEGICITTTLPGGADAVYTYDLFDNLTQVDLIEQASQRKQARTFTHDHLGRLFSSTNPESGTSTIKEYDATGNILEQFDASGNLLRSIYDSAGRLTEVHRQDYEKPGGDPTVVGLVLKNTYLNTATPSGPQIHANGKLIQSEHWRDETGTPTVLTKFFEYLGMNGRLSRETSDFDGWAWPSETDIGYIFNNFGLVGTITYPPGLDGMGGDYAVDYTYSNGYLTQAQPNGSPIPHATATYNAAGGLRAIMTEGGVQTDIIPDIRHRPSEITVAKWNGSGFDPATYDSDAYLYDGAGNISQIGLNNYAYDAANRLIQADTWFEGVNRKQTFQYDDFGNMTWKWHTEGGTTTDEQFLVTAPNGVNTNQILNLWHDGIPLGDFLYDARGNLTRNEAQGQDYHYDSRNRMLRSRTLNGVVQKDLAHYWYDSASNRVVKEETEREMRTYYVRDGQGRLLSEFRRNIYTTAYSPEWSKHYIYFGNRLVGLRENMRPSQPGGLSARTDRTGTNAPKITLSWEPNPASEEVTSYKVWRSPEEGFPAFGLVAQFNGTTYEDTNLIADNAYYYHVSAVRLTWTSDASYTMKVVAGDETDPSAPVGLDPEAGDRRVDLIWNENPSSELVVGYHVKRKINGPGPALKITDVPIPETSFTDLNLANGTTYKYSVVAVDTAGNQSTESASVTAMPKDYVPPGPPRGVAVAGDCTGQSSEISVSWEPNASTDDVERYLVHRTPDWAPAGPKPVDEPATTYDDTDAVAGTIYYYSVVAEDALLNQSANSLQAGVGAPFPSGTVEVPPQPAAWAGDGTVTLNVPHPPANSTVSAMKIYRKPNAYRSCGSFEYLATIDGPVGNCSITTTTDCATTSVCDEGEICLYTWSAPPPISDVLAPNNVAYDYVVTNIDDQERESGFSAPALGIPVARPLNYTECVEDLGTTWADGAENCGTANDPYYKRLVVRWDHPAAKPYQPMSATNADGTLGYLKGYRFYRYDRTEQSQKDYSVLQPWRKDYFKGRCNLSRDVVCRAWPDCPLACSGSGAQCVIDSDCPSGETCGNESCKYQIDRATHPFTDGYGQCLPSGDLCMTDRDCPAGDLCQDAPADADLVLYGDGRLHTDFDDAIFIQKHACLDMKAVYKVYANGNWLTVESGFTRNLDAFSPSPSRCIFETADVCNDPPPPCPSVEDLPPIPPAPTVYEPANEPGAVEVAWNPPGFCQVDAPASCIPSSGTCPGTGQVCEACAPGESCGTEGGKCVAVFQTCTTIAECPTGQSCVDDTADVAGYHIYAVEQTPGNFHHLRPAPVATIAGKDGGTYRLSDLAYCGDWESDGCPENVHRFRVATYDTYGRVSEPSQLSAPFNPSPSPDLVPPPGSVKTVIWTVNDGIVEEHPVFSFLDKPNPRSMNGIKVAWRPGADYAGLQGYRVWRSETPGGSYCALVDPGTGTVCLPPASVTSELSTSAFDKIYLDETVAQDVIYYYVVTAVTTAGESDYSAEVQAKLLGHDPQPLSPPLYLEATAPTNGDPGIYLSWCPNPDEEGITEYNIYRAQVSRGPYQLLTTIDMIASPNCFDQGYRCEIDQVGGEEPNPDNSSCTPGIDGTCKIIDTTTAPAFSSTFENQVRDYVYYYVVTAVRGTEESGFSAENQGWTNYNGDFKKRYDPDDFQDTPCGDEQAALENDSPVRVAQVDAESAQEPGNPGQRPAKFGFNLNLDSSLEDRGDSSGEAMAHYRLIGVPTCPECGGGGEPPGGGGGGPGGIGPFPAAPRNIYYHLDHLGTPRVITDNGGNLISKHHYMPFGEELPSQPQGSNNTRQFTGHERDDETGLDYMLARYYSSSLGRFLEPDPADESVELGDPQSWHRYAYVRNSPVIQNDPTGRVNKKVVAAGFALALLDGPSPALDVPATLIIIVALLLPEPQEGSPLEDSSGKKGKENIRDTEFETWSDERVLEEYKNERDPVRKRRLKKELKARGLYGTGGDYGKKGKGRNPPILPGDDDDGTGDDEPNPGDPSGDGDSPIPKPDPLEKRTVERS